MEVERTRLARRAAFHHALGDEHRLAIVDALGVEDLTPGELARTTGLASNLLAFHLGVLEEAAVIERRRSEGDSRRRYVRLLPAVTVYGHHPTATEVACVLFVCTHNSARSQFAEAMWRSLVGAGDVWSAGTNPASQVHPGAVKAARRFGVDLGAMQPKGFDEVPAAADVIVSVCDRAFEAGVPIEGRHVHWSIPDPIDGGPDAFRSAFDEIAGRVERLRKTVG